MSTPSPCEDTPDFADEGSFDCASEIGTGSNCWEYNFWWDYSPPGVIDVVDNCPASCDLCSTTQRMAVELKDLATSTLPAYFEPPAGSVPLDGVGPFLGSSPSDAVVQTVCLAYPGCYSLQMSVVDTLFEPPKTMSDYLHISRTSLAAAIVTGGTQAHVSSKLLFSSSRSSALISFCLSPCPSTSPFDPTLEACAPCGPGTYVNEERNTCVKCEAGTYATGFGTVGCSPCPAEFPISAVGSSSEDQCFAKHVNLYAVSGWTNRIVSYSPDDETYKIVFEGEGKWPLNYVNDFKFLNPNVMIVLNEYAGNLELFDTNGQFLGKS